MLRSVLTVLVFLLLALPASANTISQTFEFECLTSAAACPGGEGEIVLTITDGVAADEVVFTLDFVGSSAFALQAVYFEANPFLTALVSVTNTPDVGFVIGSQPGVPAVVPGGSFGALIVSTTGVGTTDPAYVTSGEQLVIVGQLASGALAEDIIAGLLAGDFRVGILLGDDGLATVPVPEPALLGLLGIAGLAYAGRRRTA